jgi:outer membrane protein OmpA-like peptidoglycan-associated protein
MGVGTQLALATASASEKNGIYDKEINGGGFRWNDFNPNGSRSNSSNYLDWNSGVYYKYKGQELDIEIGAAGYHYLHPKNSLITFDSEHRLRGRIVLHSKVDMSITPYKILTFQNIFWTEGLYWVSKSLDKYNLVSNWAGIELSRAIPSDNIYINYGMYTRSFKTIMPYASFVSRNGFNLRASYEIPFNNTRFDAYTAKRFEVTLNYTLGYSASNRTAKANRSSVPSSNTVIPNKMVTKTPPPNTMGVPSNNIARGQNNSVARGQGNMNFGGIQNIDRDKDGLTDNVDRCPDIPGPLNNQGCPLSDRDGDGIPDVSDKCPDNAGLPVNNGCPEYVKGKGNPVFVSPNSDRDKDGILDKDDLCPDLAGSINNQGCPLSDMDGDGVPDVADRCPDVSGSPTNDGCPEKMIVAGKTANSLSQVKVDTLKYNIYFDTDKYGLTPSAFEELTSVISQMKQNNDYKCLLVGHSDVEGSVEYNLTLSKNRTGVARSYLMSYGIADSRIVTKYVGGSQPLPINNKEMFWMNRRVAIYIYKSK